MPGPHQQHVPLGSPTVFFLMSDSYSLDFIVTYHPPSNTCRTLLVKQYKTKQNQKTLKILIFFY